VGLHRTSFQEVNLLRLVAQFFRIETHFSIMVLRSGKQRPAIPWSDTSPTGSLVLTMRGSLTGGPQRYPVWEATELQASSSLNNVTNPFIDRSTRYEAEKR
jgi:hypothetical protein